MYRLIDDGVAIDTGHTEDLAACRGQAVLAQYTKVGHDRTAFPTAMQHTSVSAIEAAKMSLIIYSPLY